MQYVRRLDRALVVEATRQTHALWGDGRPLREHTANVFEQLCRAGPGLLRYVGLVERGRLYASIKRYSIALRGPLGLIPAVGIGAVFTRPSARGRGLAQQLVQAVLAEARELGEGGAFLYSDIEPEFYARLGFVPLPARDFVVDVDALPSAGALDLRPARARDLDAMIELHAASFPSAWLRPTRSRHAFRFFTWRNGVRAWILSSGGRDEGYLLAGRDDPMRDLPHPREPGLLFLDEAFAPRVPEARLWATVAALAARLRTRRVWGWVPPTGAPAGARVVPRAGAFPMIAALDPAVTVRPRRSWLDSFQHF